MTKKNTHNLTTHQRQFLGIIMIAFFLTIALIWGNHFNIFNTHIKINMAYGGFFFWIAIAFFGLGYGANNVRTGIIWSGIFMLAMLTALTFGVLIGSYH